MLGNLNDEQLIWHGFLKKDRNYFNTIFNFKILKEFGLFFKYVPNEFWSNRKNCIIELLFYLELFLLNEIKAIFF